jgi:hypothetical protein
VLSLGCVVATRPDGRVPRLEQASRGVFSEPARRLVVVGR